MHLEKQNCMYRTLQLDRTILSKRKRRIPVKRVLKTPPKKRRAFEKEVATAILDLANKASVERSSEDLSLAESLLGLGEKGSTERM